MQRNFSHCRLWITVLLAGLALLGWSSGARAQFLNKLKGITDKAQKVKQSSEVTPEQEQALGREVAAKAIAYFGLYQSQPLTRYVNLVGATVAAQAERQDIKYHFAVLDSDDINAFSAPGGYVFITRGALALCEDESELAGVLAHEVGHIAGKHVVKIIERDRKERGIADEVSSYKPGSAEWKKYADQAAKNLLVRMIDQGLPPNDEFDADKRGAEYAHAAGYPADGLERFLVQLDKATQQGGRSWLTRTHPPAKDRIDRLQKLIAGQHWEDTDRPRLAERLAMAKVALPKAASPKPKAGS